MDKSSALVSIITPSYNCADYIGDTIEAVQNQSFKNWEMLITDDCSSDNSVSIIEEYAEQDDRVKLFRLNNNSGAGAARNNSITEAKGRYIAFCDSDDLWHPEKLEKQLSFMQEKDAAFVYGSYYECDERLNRTGIVRVPEKLSFKEEKHVNQVGTVTAIYDTQKVGKQYMPLIRKSQDWALWLKILKICKVGYGYQDPCADYRMRPYSNSSDKKRMIKFHAAVYEEVFRYPHWLAILYTLLVNVPAHLLKRGKIEKI